MKTYSNTPATADRESLREFGPLAALFAWTDRHPRAASVLLWLMVAALIYAVFTYEFTIPMYK